MAQFVSFHSEIQLAVVPVLVNPLLVLLPALLLGLLSALVSLLRPRAVLGFLKLLWRIKLSLLIVAGCVAGVVLAFNGNGTSRGKNVANLKRGVHDSKRDWPLIRGGLTRTGAASQTPEPGRGGLNWIYSDGNTGFLSSPAVAGDFVYVSTARLAVFGGGRGEILCLDCETGGVVWRSRPQGYRATFSSPVISGDYLVCGEGVHTTPDARIVCLDLREGHQGEVLWTHRTQSHVECSPVISGGRVYVGAGEDGYYCLKLEGDGRGNPKVCWHASGEEFPDAETSLVVHDGRVYAGLGASEGAEAVCVLDAETGKLIRRIETQMPVFSPPAIAHGCLYVGMGHGDYVNTAEEVGEPPAGEVWCIELETLRVKWRFRTGRIVLGAVAVFEDRIYFGSRDGFVYCVGKDGQLCGKWNTHSPIVASPAVTQQHVVVVNSAGFLYCLERQTLQPVWEYRLGTKPLFVSSPAVAQGRVFVGTQHDGLVCVGRQGRKQEREVWPGRLGGAGVAGNVDDSPVSKFGDLLWHYPSDETGESKSEAVTAPVAPARKRLIVPLCGGKERSGVVCLRPDIPSDKSPQQAWRYSTPNGVFLSPAVSGGLVFAVDGKKGQRERSLHAIDWNRGALRWKVPVASEASGVMSCTETSVLVQDRPGSLSRFDRCGNLLWSQPAGPLDRAPDVTEALLAAAVTEPPELVVMDLPTGRTLWRVGLDGAPTTSPVIRGDTIYLGTAESCVARSLLNGAQRNGWTQRTGGVASDLLVTRRMVSYVNTAGHLLVLSRNGGEVLRTEPGACPGVAPVLVREKMLYAGKDAVMALDTNQLDKAAVNWAGISWLGPPVTPMVFARSRLHFGIAGWGLVCFGEGR